jgi:CRISPR-associated protein Csm4
MIWYRAILQMHSWTASEWQADTIFGHLCWGMRYLYGEKELKDFLNLYEIGAPPLLVSNGFPGDLLPKPSLPPMPADYTISLGEQRQLFDSHKNVKKIECLTPEEFARALNGEIPSQFLNTEVGSESHQIKRITLKNQIDRLTNTTGGEGQLFPFEEFHWDTVSIYLRVGDGFVDKAHSLFDYLAKVGYGKRKSVGYGQIESYSFKQFDGFPATSNANGFVTLSNFVPSANDPAVGNWSLLVKYGKLGEEYAQEEIAFKKPLLMLEAGSTFYDSPVKQFYGRMVHGVSPAYPQVVQYGFALPIPMKLPHPEATRYKSVVRKQRG